MKRAIVVGASSGIGLKLADQLAERGWKVAVIARREERLKALQELYPLQVTAYVHDVHAYDDVPGLFQEITKQLEGLDLIIYAAGVMPEVGPSEFNFAKDREMIEVNVLGAIAWLNEAATRMQNTRHGSIVAIGSVAGDRGRAGQPVYNTSKAALATFMEALRNRLSQFGVKVVTIKPGPVETEMTAHLKMRGVMSADEAARRILDRMDRTGEHYLQHAHRFAFWIIKRIPSPIFRRLKI